MRKTVPTYDNLIRAEFGPGFELIESHEAVNGWLLIYGNGSQCVILHDVCGKVASYTFHKSL